MRTAPSLAVTDPKKFITDNISVSSNGCWNWLGKIDNKGYGACKGTGAYRVSYEAFRGPIPAGLELDHLCRNRACVNPWHLEAVTRRVNNLRSNSVGGVNARKTHCAHGHQFTAENTAYARVCLTCDRRRIRTYKQRRRAQRAKLAQAVQS